MKKIFTASRFKAPSTTPRQKMLNKLEAVNCETWSTMAAMKTRCAYYLGMAFFEIDLISSFFPPRDSSKLSSVTSFPKAFSKLAKKTPQLPHGHMTLFHGDTVSLHSLAISGQNPRTLSEQKGTQRIERSGGWKFLRFKEVENQPIFFQRFPLF